MQVPGYQGVLPRAPGRGRQRAYCGSTGTPSCHALRLTSVALQAHVHTAHIHASTRLVDMALVCGVTDLDLHNPGGPQPGCAAKQLCV